MRKSYYLIALAAILFTQTQSIFAQEHSCNVEFNERPGWDAPRTISDNGRWVIGVSGIESSYMWNTMTKEYEYFAGDETISFNLYDITDEGMAVGSHNEFPATHKNGEWTNMESPDKWRYSSIMSVTPDGSRMAGWGNKNGYKSACAWIDGTPFELKMPALDPEGKLPQSVSAEKISADGTVIIGFSRNDMGRYGTGVIWRNFGEDPSTAQPEVIFEDSIKAQKWLFYNIMDISPNGKWIAGICAVLKQVEGEEPGVMDGIVYLYRYNLETEKMEIIEDVEDIDPGMGDGGVTCVDDLGTVFSYGLPQAASNPCTRSCWVSKRGEASQSLGDYIKNVYGGNEFVDRLDFPGTVSSISADGKIMVGFGSWADEDGGLNQLEWLITLDGTTGISCNEISDNPMKCFVNGKMLSVEGDVVSVEIINTNGSVVYGSSVNAKNISLDQLPAGIYAAKLTDGKEVKVQKIVLGR